MTTLISKLHPLERKVFPYLKEGISLNELVKITNLKDIEVMRALQWLENKEVLKINTKVKEIISLGKNGESYKKNGLPELRFLKSIKGPTPSSKINLSKEELSPSIGILKKKVAINIEKKGKDLVFNITPQGKKILDKGLLEQKFLQRLPIETSELTAEDKFAYDNLKSRKDIVNINVFKEKTIEITEEGNKLLKKKIDVKNFIDTLNPKMLKQGSWKNKTFRAYDIKINVPKMFFGQRQPYMRFLKQIKTKLVQMGFKEMTGPLIETEFYNFDVLFQPQNHPARTWTDTYHIKKPIKGKLPSKKIVDAIKFAHETGGNTKSTGWNYKWNSEIAKQLMPRAQGTALSARQLVKGIEIPGMYFAIARCYRPDVLDATHLIEFNQMEGFVADESLNFSSLLGILKHFAIEVAGAEKVKFFPDYYPFTEPSVQMSAKHPDLGWVELGGAGMFRPEILKPLGIDVPVIAWGLGIDRLAMYKLGINDIRYLFSTDLNWLRKSRLI